MLCKVEANLTIGRIYTLMVMISGIIREEADRRLVTQGIGYIGFGFFIIAITAIRERISAL